MDVSSDGDPFERMVFEVSWINGSIKWMNLPDYFVLFLFKYMSIDLHLSILYLQLFNEVAPKTAENFRALCTGCLSFNFWSIFYFNKFA